MLTKINNNIPSKNWCNVALIIFNSGFNTESGASQILVFHSSFKSTDAGVGRRVGGIHAVTQNILVDSSPGLKATSTVLSCALCPLNSMHSVKHFTSESYNKHKQPAVRQASKNHSIQDHVFQWKFRPDVSLTSIVDSEQLYQKRSSAFCPSNNNLYDLAFLSTCVQNGSDFERIIIEKR